MADDLSHIRARQRMARQRHSSGPEVPAEHPLSDAALWMALQRMAFEAETVRRHHGDSALAVGLWEKASRVMSLRAAMIRVVVRLSSAPATVESFATGGRFTGRTTAGLPDTGPMSRESVLSAVEHWRARTTAALGTAGGDFTRAAEILWQQASEDHKLGNSMVALMCVAAARLIPSKATPNG